MMKNIPSWWMLPRNISVVVDNPSWILPHAEKLVADLEQQGDHAVLCTAHDQILGDGIAFFLGCVHITPPGVLAKNRVNLVVHESALPEGKGFAPLTWQILEGKNDIVVSLIEAVDEVDAGRILLQQTLHFEGHELCDEIRQAQGEITIRLCREYLAHEQPPEGREQHGASTFYPRRYPADSELDITRSIRDQFNLFRVADNERYPLFFKINGHTYLLKISKEKG